MSSMAHNKPIWWPIGAFKESLKSYLKDSYDKSGKRVQWPFLRDQRTNQQHTTKARKNGTYSCYCTKSRIMYHGKLSSRVTKKGTTGPNILVIVQKVKLWETKYEKNVLQRNVSMTWSMMMVIYQYNIINLLRI